MSVQVPKGYKQTEVGVIPEDWEVKEIGDICKISKGKGLLKNEIKDFGNIPAIPYTAIYTDFNEIVDYKKISYFTNELEKTITVDEPSVLIASSSNMDKNTGKATALTKNIPVAIGREVIIFTSQQNTAFISYLLSTNFYRKKTLILARGTTIKHVYPETFRKYKISVPSKKEQNLISESLLDADALIESLEQLIAKKRQIKQGAMQELLTGQRRLPGFSGEWIPKRLGDAATLKARIGWQGLKTDEYLEHGDFALVTGTEFKNGKIVWNECYFVDEARYKQDKNIQLKEDDILVTKDGTIGKVALVSDLIYPATLNSGVFVIRPKQDEFNQKFFFYMLQSSVFKKFLDQLSAGSTINHLYQKDFVNFIFYLPPTLNEQYEISDFLESLDAEIGMLDVRLLQARQIKQSMMQELLTGRIRLI